jgi:ubiquitin-conjugating enzyme E2 J2
MLSEKGMKRVMKEIENYKKDKNNRTFTMAFSEMDMQVIYGIFRNLDGVYSGGEYIIRVKLPTDYPYSPPVVACLTPNGRFDAEQNICLSITHYHSETWCPLITIEKLLMSVVSVFYDDYISGIGSNHNGSPEHKKELAKTSKEYNMEHFSDILAMELK